MAAFQGRFPATPLRLYIEGRCALVQQVLERRSPVGIMASLSPPPLLLTSEPLLMVPMVMVVSPRHPLAIHGGPIPTSLLAEHVQLVSTDPAHLPHDRELGLLSPRTWLLAHLGAKLDFLRAGFGFGFMPLPVIEADLLSRNLIQIWAEDAPPKGHVVVMSAVYRTDNPPGPAGRWLIDHLKQGSAQRSKQPVTLAATFIADDAPRAAPAFTRYRAFNRAKEMRTD